MFQFFLFPYSIQIGNRHVMPRKTWLWLRVHYGDNHLNPTLNMYLFFLRSILSVAQKINRPYNSYYCINFIKTWNCLKKIPLNNLSGRRARFLLKRHNALINIWLGILENYLLNLSWIHIFCADQSIKLH